MRRKLPKLDDSATCFGILMGIVLGGLYTLLHITQRGNVRRKDLTQFGAGTGELEMKSSLNEAKRLAKSRSESRD